MSDLFKNTRRLSMVLSALLLAITLAAGSFAYVTNGLPVAAPETLPGEDAILDSTDITEDNGDEPFLSDEPAAISALAGMRGVILTPGEDFIKTDKPTADTICAEIDSAIKSAKDLKMNAAIISTSYDDRVIYQTSDAKEFSSDFDIMEYLVVKCREQGLYVYAVFDASPYTGGTGITPMSDGGDSGMDKLSKNAGEFAGKYGLDGILIDGYAGSSAESSYVSYLNFGGGIGFDNFIRQTPAAIVKSAANAIRKAAPGTQSGLLADAVWANKSDNEQGSATKAAYTSFYSAGADTKGFVERGYVDFVAVRAYSSMADEAEPFETVVSWWADVAVKSGMPLYVIHASSKIGTKEAGWSSPDTLEKQIETASSFNGFYGSIFNNLQKLAGAEDAAAPVVEHYEKQDAPEPGHVLKELVMTKPEKTSYSTYEQSVTFVGACEPSMPVTINGENVKVDASGYFSVTARLESGENKFYVRQNNKEVNYVINRQIQILKEISPMGSVTAEKGMDIEISALAYADAEVYAMVNGKKVMLEIDETSDESNRDSTYKLFTGEYSNISRSNGELDTDPVQNLGSIKVYAKWKGQSESLDGAYLKLYKATASTEKTPVVVTANQARTYPGNTTTNVPSPSLYPLPKGAFDYAVGEPIIYKRGKDTFEYPMLSSGVRVESADIKTASTKVKNNSITGMSVLAANDGFTYVSLATSQKISYSFSYKGDSVQILFHNTTRVPNGIKLSSNPIFKKAAWSDGNKLTLTLAKTNGFMGFKGYYDKDDNLVFRFNNPPSSIKKAKIAIDPGHGGKDFGALGFLADYPEKTINLSIAEKLAAELEARGAEVQLLESAGYTAPYRTALAENFKADILVSIHCNSSTKTSTSGTEVYYFYPFSKQLAVNASANVSKQLETINRGAKQSYYYVTLSTQMASVLVETGFISNKTEYNKLVKSKNQKNIAKGIADSIASAIKTANTGIASTGEESTGNMTIDPSDNVDDGDSVDSVSLNYTTATLASGKKLTLKAIIDPSNAADKTVSWKSGNTSVASVDEDGVVTAKKEGSAKITVTTNDGKKTAVCVVKVVKSGSEDDSDSGSSVSSASADTGIELSRVKNVRVYNDYLVIYPGNSQRVEIFSENDQLVRNRDFAWKSAKTSIATVDKYGVVTAKAVGNTTVTAVAGNVELVCDIEVDKTKVAVKGISLNKTSTTILRGKTERLTANLIPSNATDRTVTWTSSQSKIASVDSNGVITAVNGGKAVITARTKSGSFTAKCEVTVVTKAIEIDYIEIFDMLEMKKGDSDILDVTIWPDDATSSDVKWSSSSSRVVSVDSEGRITALAKGKATIKVTSASNSAIFSECVITVYD